MLLKWCVFIVILSHKVVSCHTNVETGSKEDSISITANNTTVFRRSSIVYKKRTSLDMKLHPTIKELGRRQGSGRWLEEYQVVTSDEYILTIFRLIYQNKEPPPKKCPVLLVHGIFQSSDRFLQQTEDQSLAIKLQDLDYDVWLANLRGNQYGRLHVFLNPETDDKSKFFNYNYEAFGLYDVASTVDFVLNKTTSEKLHYIGHSLGGTAFLVLNSLKPEYNSKFATAYLMAPLGYQHYFPNDYLKAVVSHLDELYKALLKEGAIEIFPFTDKYTKFSINDCLGNKRYKKICEELNIQKCMLPVADSDPQSDGPLASDRDLFIDDDGSGLEIDESSGSGWGPGPGPDDEDGRGSGDRAPFDDEDYTPRTIPTTTTPAPEPVPETTVDPEYVAPRVLVEKPSPGAETPRGAGEEQPSRPEPDISISGEDVNPGTDQDPSGTNVGAESRPQDNVVFIMNAKPEDRATSFFAQPGILAAVIGGAVVGLLCAILVVMFIVYRMRKKDEGSYALDEPKRSPAAASYGKGQNNREFYA